MDDEQQRPNSIVSDAFDRVMFDTFKQTSTVIQEQAKKSLAAECLTEDVFNSFFKSKPEFQAEAPQLQRELIESMQQLPEYKDLRSETVHDDISSALASAKLAPDLVSRLVQIEQKRQEQQKNNPDGKPDPGIPGDLKSEIRAQMRKGLNNAQEQIDNWSECVTGWGIKPGELQKLPLKEKLELVKNLLSTAKFRQIAELAGRLRNIANASMAMTPTHGNDELVDITQGDNISRILPTELLKLKRTPALFMKDLLERKLLQYNLRGEEPQGRGPIVVCVDISGSMQGQREIWAKAVMLALAHICDRQNRAFAVVTFDTQVRHHKVYESGKLELKEKIDLAMIHMKGGGTAFMPPLKKGFEIVSKVGKMNKADIIFVTDGECGLDDKDLATVKALKAQYFTRILGVGIGNSAVAHGDDLAEFSDDLVFISDTGDIEFTREIFTKTVAKRVG